MLRKIVTVLIALSILPILVMAQERTVLKPIGMTYLPAGTSGNNEVIPLSKWQKFRLNKFIQNKNNFKSYSNPDNTLSFIDTLFTNPTPITPGSNFGFFGQDRMLMWFQAPADLILKEVGFDFISINQPAPTLEVKIVQVIRPIEELEFLGDGWWGYYEATGNGQHDATSFLDDPDRTGPWMDSPQTPDPGEIFGNDIWSDNGVGQPFVPNDDTLTVGTYQFIDLSALGYPDIPAGTIFGVVLKNLEPTLGGGKRVGIFGNPVGSGGTYQNPLWKYYSDANTNTGTPPDDWGWWSRDIPLSYAAVVEIYGNTAPDINSFTTIPSDVNLGPFTIDANITDENAGQPDSAGVASAMIQWSTDGGATWNDVSMSGTEPIYTGEIPAQPGGVMITYRISATDITSLTSNSDPVSFYIFQPSGANTLVIYNGFTGLTGFPQDAYFGVNIAFDHDSWNYGEVSAALLNNYDNVIEIWNEANGVYNESLISAWIAGASDRNYCLAGQEYLGLKNGYVDSSFIAGTFEYDILGIDSSFNDISYYFPPPNFNESYGDSLTALVTPVAGTMFGQPLKDLFDSITPAPDSMMYNPLFVTGNLNWQDGFHTISGVQVDMTVETKGMGDEQSRQQPIVRTIPTLAHRTLTAGNKVIFHAYDPVSLTTADNDSYPYFYWVGGDTLNSMYQTLKWFGIETTIVGVEENEFTPNNFALEQNYPNPFNPSTTIKFSIPQSSKVTLKIYDILGSEVSTLVNETRNAGSYEVTFDASGLSSGMYIYSLSAGEFKVSKKMILIK